MTTKLCDFCGKEIPVNSKICPYCNKALSGNEFSYTVPEKKTVSEQNAGLDIAKYLNNDKQENKDDYFSTNIYSFSQKEIERRFERKTAVYDEEEREQRSENYRIQRDLPVRSNRHQRKKNNSMPIIIAVAVILVIVILIIAVSGGNDDKVANVKSTTTTTMQTKTEKTTESETTSQKTTESTTQAPAFDESRSVDLCGYLFESFSEFESHFGTQIKDPVLDEFYDGYTYYYDGMSVSTDANGTICAMNIDFATMSNKTAYYFKDNESGQNITFFSNYNEVLGVLGEPDSDQMSDSSDPSVTYQIYTGSSQYIKIKFDSDNKVSGFDLFLAD